tara:strand:+ start:1146 stop:1559 length:414 start_codon:yes stop_codon:yes gene_type:complete
MATTTYLTNPVVLIGIVDITDQCSSATITVGYDSLEATAFGDTGHRFVQGLQSVDVSLTVYASYGAAEMEATFYALLGAGTSTVVISDEAGAASATNPKYTISNAMMATFTPYTGTVGELSTYDITLTGGTFVRAIA